MSLFLYIRNYSLVSHHHMYIKVNVLVFRWLVLTFTLEHTAVIDIFAGCGGLGVVCAERHRHCLCVDYDRPVFDRHLGRFGDIAVTPLAVTANDPKDLDEDTDWEQYEP